MNPNWFSAATPKATEPVPGPMPESMRRAQGAKTKEGDPIPVVIYVRVSSNVQDIKNSIEAQIEECLRYARANNMIVVAIYRDEAFTGTISSRPGFQSLIADATNPDTEFHTILVWKLSRFARNKYDSVTYEHMLEKRGIKVISVTEPIDDSRQARC
jgi:site-specific DNA recombinase